MRRVHLLIPLILSVVTASELTRSQNNRLTTRANREGKNYFTFCQVGQTNICKQHSRTFNTDARNYSIILDLFVSHLKGYVTARSFDVGYFKINMVSLQSELRELLPGPPGARLPAELMRKVQFTTTLFDLMVSSTASLIHCSLLGTPGNRLLYKIIELNVRAHALCDSQGRLDGSDPDSALKIEEIHHTLEFWAKRFDMLTEVTMDTRQFFREELQKAENIIKQLRAQRPTEEEIIFQTRCGKVCHRILVDGHGNDE